MKKIKLFKWQKGRQYGCDYYKFPLWYFRIWRWGFDAYILKFKAKSEVPWHKDPVKNGKHYRINIRLSGWATFIIEEDGRRKPYLVNTDRWFRPDICPHMLVVITDYKLLSFGFVKFTK